MLALQRINSRSLILRTIGLLVTENIAQATTNQVSAGLWPLVVSLLSLLIAVVSLVWNVYTHKRQGPAPKAELTWALYPERGEETSSAAEETRGELIQPHDPYVVVVVTNTGRGQIDVSQITFHASKGKVGTSIGRRKYPPLPLTLDGAAEAHWEFRFDTILSALDLVRNDAEDVHAIVRLGNGRTIKTKNLSLPDLFRLVGGAFWFEKAPPRHSAPFES